MPTCCVSRSRLRRTIAQAIRWSVSSFQKAWTTASPRCNGMPSHCWLLSRWTYKSRRRCSGHQASSCSLLSTNGGCYDIEAPKSERLKLIMTVACLNPGAGTKRGKDARQGLACIGETTGRTDAYIASENRKQTSSLPACDFRWSWRTCCFVSLDRSKDGYPAKFTSLSWLQSSLYATTPPLSLIPVSCDLSATMNVARLLTENHADICQRLDAIEKQLNHLPDKIESSQRAAPVKTRARIRKLPIALANSALQDLSEGRLRSGRVSFVPPFVHLRTDCGSNGYIPQIGTTRGYAAGSWRNFIMSERSFRNVVGLESTPLTSFITTYLCQDSEVFVCRPSIVQTVRSGQSICTSRYRR